MLHAIASTDLHREPRQVRVMHHDFAGVALIAVSYDVVQPALSPLARNYVTVAELPMPYDGNRPLRVVKVAVPGVGVSAIALTRSVDGTQALLVVQCIMEECTEEDNKSSTPHVETFIYRRTLASGNDDDDEDAEEEDAMSADDDAEEVTYVRLPKAVPTAGRVWTTAAGLHSTENALPSSEQSSPMAIVAASGSGLLRQRNALQWMRLQGGTRADVAATVEIPGLSSFEIGSVMPVGGTGGSLVLLRCHHLIAEVDLRRAMDEKKVDGGNTVVSNTAISRTWRWTPHDRLTSCCLADYMLIAGTEDGTLVVWDVRLPEGHEHAQTHCAAAGSDDGGAITGVHAPHSACIVSCDLGGSVWCWQYAQQEALAASTRFPYERTAPVGDDHSSSRGGCLAMDGDGHLVAVIREYGLLDVYVYA